MDTKPLEMITDRIDAITRIPAEYKHAKPPIPKSVKIELTARCDLACFFCATASKLRDKGDMEWSFLERILPEMRREGVEELGLFYLGESFLYPRLAEAIRTAKRIGYPYIFLTTNGRRATFQEVYLCVDAGLDSLKFSLNAHDAASYRAITRVDAFDAVVKNIKASRRAIGLNGSKCGLYVSSILYDETTREKMQPILDELMPYIDQHYWLPLYSQAGLREGNVAGNVGRLDAMRESLPCWSAFTEGHVTFDGHLSACCFDHDGRFHMGDLNKMSFREAWESEKFQELRRRHLEKDVAGTACQQCIAYA